VLSSTSAGNPWEILGRNLFQLLIFPRRTFCVECGTQSYRNRYALSTRIPGSNKGCLADGTGQQGARRRGQSCLRPSSAQQSRRHDFYSCVQCRRSNRTVSRRCYVHMCCLQNACRICIPLQLVLIYVHSSGVGGWFDISRISVQEAAPINPGRSKYVSAQNSQAGSQTHSKAPSRAESPLVDGAHAHSKTPPEAIDGASAPPPQSPGAVSRKSDASNEKKEEHVMAYSGQVRVRCSWLRFPEIWEWKACPSAKRHTGEVTGLAFSWGDWGPGGLLEKEVRREVPQMVITSCSLGGDIRTWKWEWSITPATDAEGDIMCSIYDRDLIAREKERARAQGKEYQGPGSSNPSSRPGTSNSSNIFSRKSSVKDAPTPSSIRPGSKDGQRQGGRQGARPGSKEGARLGDTEGVNPTARPGSRESAHPSTLGDGSGELSKNELRELEAQTTRQRQWEEGEKNGRGSLNIFLMCHVPD